MITGSFNGWDIVALPTTPALRNIDFIEQDIVGAPVSPYSRQTQVQDWTMAWWEATISWARMPQVQFMPFSAFVSELRGRLRCVQLSHPLWKHPAGLGRGAPVCNGAQVPRAWSITTRGWAPNLRGQLLPGDFLEIGYRLHKVLEIVNSDSSGNATINVWPNVRAESYGDGAPIVLNHPSGLFRLGNNKRQWAVDGKSRLVGITALQLVEAI